MRNSVYPFVDLNITDCDFFTKHRKVVEMLILAEDYTNNYVAQPLQLNSKNEA